MDAKEAKNIALEIARKVEEGNLSSFTFEFDGLRVKAEKQSAAQAPQRQCVPSPEPDDKQDPEKEEISGQKVLSPLVGTFYAGSAPGGKPFVTVGSEVSKGDTLCIIEAMKMLNTIESPCGGRVKSIHMADGQMAEYGQLLMVIE